VRQSAEKLASQGLSDRQLNDLARRATAFLEGEGKHDGTLTGSWGVSLAIASQFPAFVSMRAVNSYDGLPRFGPASLVRISTLGT
jgi:hypothetical protein